VKVRRRGGVIRLRLEPVESRMLSTLFNDLVDIVVAQDAEADDPVQRRLFPAGYRDDDDAESEFRALTETALRTERSDRAKQCAAEVAGDRRELELTDESGQRWIQVLNDVRLALGTRLEVSEEDGPEIDPDDPLAPQRAIYYWLTAFQDSLVGALMG
jgi:Domain of unknown function (DUF2017)